MYGKVKIKPISSGILDKRATQKQLKYPFSLLRGNKQIEFSSRDLVTLYGIRTFCTYWSVKQFFRYMEKYPTNYPVILGYMENQNLICHMIEQ